KPNDNVNVDYCYDHGIGIKMEYNVFEIDSNRGEVATRISTYQ
ncbi:18761_t:CDS:1, partial [Dentiscutata erythropus]